MAKRLTEKQKSEIADYFKDGKSIEALSEEFNCTLLTIARNLKKNLGEKIYKELLEKNKNIDNLNTLSKKHKKKNDFVLAKNISKNELGGDLSLCTNEYENNNFSSTEFI